MSPSDDLLKSLEHLDFDDLTRLRQWMHDSTPLATQ
jgi:hypothetical protein